MKRKTKEERPREDNLVLGALNMGLKFTTTKGEEFTMSPLSVSRIGILQRMNKILSEKDISDLEMFMVMFWVGVAEISELLNHLVDGSVELAFYQFMDRFLPEDIEKIVDLTKGSTDITESGIVEIMDDDGGKKVIGGGSDEPSWMASMLYFLMKEMGMDYISAMDFPAAMAYQLQHAHCRALDKETRYLAGNEKAVDEMKSMFLSIVGDSGESDIA